MGTEAARRLDLLSKHLVLSSEELKEIMDNYSYYETAVEELLGRIARHTELKDELSSLSAKIARLNYENYETYMAIHTNSIAISGHRAAIKISGQRLSKDVEEDLTDLLAKYLMLKF